MSANAMLVRTATLADAHGIAVVHVRSWQAAYRGLMPQDVLDGLSIDDREAGWERILAAPNKGSQTLVAVRDDEVVGWTSFGRARDADAVADAELWGIYAHPDAFGCGVGHALITAVEDALRADGFTSAYLWVLDGNERASGFYERHGWHADGGEKVDERPGLELHERRHVKRL